MAPRQRRTRLVATIGPASVDVVADLVRVGLDVARINLSHGSSAEHARSARAVRAAATAAGRHVGLLVDLPGPKLRLGELPADGIELTPGEVVGLIGSDKTYAPGRLPLADDALLARLKAGDRILLADGVVELRVVGSSGPPVPAEIVRGGQVRSHQGCSVPAERMLPDAWRDADEAVIPHLLELEPDFVGQSFVRTGSDVETLRGRLPAGARIVAKIETRPAVEDIAAILEAADAVMVARGDLGVELPFEQVPLVQKDLVSAALAAGRPSIVATQMLESMVHAPRPTRAEASDVANAILDGADAVMLSAETAVGSWPVEALEAAARICEAVDDHPMWMSVASPTMPSFEVEPGSRALAQAAVAMADADPQVVALACYTHTGRTARLLASCRPRVPIVAFTVSEEAARALTLRRGVLPVALPLADDEAAFVAGSVRTRLADIVAPWAPPAGATVVLVETGARGGRDALELVRL